MPTQFSSKQPSEEYAISFDFTLPLGAENIASATITAVDQTTLLNVSTTILEVLNQTNTTKIVYGWVQNGTSGRDYLITCTIIGDGAPASTYELDGILPVREIPATVAASSGGTRCVTEPVLEPVTLAELRTTSLGIDSGTMATDSTLYTSIAAGSHGVVSAYTLLGTAINVLGHTTVVYLTPVNNGSSGTVDVKIQESDTLAGTYTDWATGAFTQVTEANDTTIQEKAYTGSKAYIRTVAKTLVSTCEFGTSIMVWEPNVSEDDMLDELITAGRLSVENDTGRRIMQQTWDYCPKSWPSGDRIKLPFGNLQSVTSVKWNIEMMLDGDMGEVSEEQKTQLQTIQTVTTDLADLVSMLLDVSRIQLGRMKVDRTDLKLDEFFSEILTVIEPKAQQKKQKFVKNIPAKLPVAMLDKRLMRMTLENLLTNAVKYTPDGGQVMFSVTVEGNKLRYSVKDTGYGIPKADQEKIFGQLFRASNVQKVDGNGLGLFAAKGAVEAQEGSIRFESEEGKGTTFFVELPIIAPSQKSQS